MCPLFLWHLVSLSRVPIDLCDLILHLLYHCLECPLTSVIKSYSSWTRCIISSVACINWSYSFVSCRLCVSSDQCPLSLVPISCVHCLLYPSAVSTVPAATRRLSTLYNILHGTNYSLSYLLSQKQRQQSLLINPQGGRPHHLFCCTIFNNIFLRVVTFSHTPDTNLELKDATWRGPSAFI